MSKKKNKLTRQGVRDLSGLKSKPLGIRLETPPSMVEAFCKHHNKYDLDYSGDIVCRDCGKVWEYKVPR